MNRYVSRHQHVEAFQLMSETKIGNIPYWVQEASSKPDTERGSLSWSHLNNEFILIGCDSAKHALRTGDWLIWHTADWLDDGWITCVRAGLFETLYEPEDHKHN